jgi:hypothetical protein
MTPQTVADPRHVKLTVILTPDNHAAMCRAAELDEAGKTDTVNRALAVYGAIIQAAAAGGRERLLWLQGPHTIQLDIRVR